MRRQFGKRPLLVACDVYRPAAITQLQVVGKQLDIPVFEMGQANPVHIAGGPSNTPGPRPRHGVPGHRRPSACGRGLMNELKNIKAKVIPTKFSWWWTP